MRGGHGHRRASGDRHRPALGWAQVSRTAEILRVAASVVLAAESIAVLAAVAGAGTISLAPAILLVTGAIALCLAMPAYLVLRRYRQETWWSCITAGFVVGAIVAACILLPATGSVQIGQEMTVVAGRRTAAGWRMYAEAVGIAGGVGAAAASIFCAALRLLERSARSPRLGRLALTAGISLAIAVGWTVFAIPGLIMDRSCHNVFRDGRTSISPVLFFAVEVGEGEWPRLQDIVDRFATDERWAVDQSNADDKAFSPRRFVDVCTEPGTDIILDGFDAPGAHWVTVSVYQPQGGDSWQEPARHLLAAIEAGFPGRLRRTAADKEVLSPSALLP